MDSGKSAAEVVEPSEEAGSVCDSFVCNSSREQMTRLSYPQTSKNSVVIKKPLVDLSEGAMGARCPPHLGNEAASAEEQGTAWSPSVQTMPAAQDVCLWA